MRAGLVATLLILLAFPSYAQNGGTMTVGASTNAIACGETTDITFGFAPDGPSTPGVRGYSVTISAPEGLTFGAADITVLSPVGGAIETSFVTPNGPNDFTIDFTFLSPGTTLDAAADLFVITMQGTAAGAATVGVAGQIFRDIANQPITMDAAATVQIDQTCFNAPTLDPEPEFTMGTVNEITWSDESTGAALKYFAQVSTDPEFTTLKDTSGWITTLKFTFTPLDEDITYYYRVKAGLADDTSINSDYSAVEVSVQDATPPVTMVDPLAPEQYLQAFFIPYQAADAISGVAGVELFYRYEGGEWISYGNYSDVFPFPALSGDGLYEFYTVGTDNAGNVEATTPAPQASTTLNTSNPFGSFTINNGAVATNLADVSLQTSILRATEMRFSNDNLTWPEGWIPLTASHAWVIPASEGPQTVYGEFRDGSGGLFTTNVSITYDVTAPGAATTVMVSPNHESASVSWTPPADLDYDHGEVWRAVLHDGSDVSTYPTYTGSTIPTPPADRAAALASSEWILAGTSASGEATFVDTEAARGIYYYEVFAIDQATNVSAPAGDVPRATNYVLADVIAPYDGIVAVHDLTLLSANFGLISSDIAFNPEVDFGPTSDGTGTGIPLPDGIIDFNDEMIASMNYQPSAKSSAGDRGPGQPVSLTWRPSGPSTWTLELTTPRPDLKGVRVAADLPPGIVPMITTGSALREQAGNHLLLNDGRNGLDAGLVVLGQGRGITGSGELLTITLPRGSDLDLLSPGNVTIEMRDRDNRSLELSFQGKADERIPAVFALEGNHPNPFNPSTTIRFSLPTGSHVALEVYGIDGRRVAVLADGLFEAGSHERTWLGRDDQGRMVASGVYFARLRAGSLSQVRKMTLMK